jgi:hypothetical protein
LGGDSAKVCTVLGMTNLVYDQENGGEKTAKVRSVVLEMTNLV